MKIERMSSFDVLEPEFCPGDASVRFDPPRPLSRAFVDAYSLYGGVMIAAPDLADHQCSATRSIIEQLFQLCQVLEQEELVVSNIEFLGSDHANCESLSAVNELKTTLAQVCQNALGVTPSFSFIQDDGRTDLRIAIA